MTIHQAVQQFVSQAQDRPTLKLTQHQNPTVPQVHYSNPANISLDDIFHHHWQGCHVTMNRY